MELRQFLIGERIVLLYSPSGAGKTSLIQAALRPDIAALDLFDIFPTIRGRLSPGRGNGCRFWRRQSVHRRDPRHWPVASTSSPPQRRGSALGEYRCVFDGL
ncbi:MAG: hypothetical protein R2854_11050 [Caldilineaceae bacterium]